MPVIPHPRRRGRRRAPDGRRRMEGPAQERGAHGFPEMTLLYPFREDRWKEGREPKKPHARCHPFSGTQNGILSVSSGTRDWFGHLYMIKCRRRRQHPWM
ncbi:unnamed protein product [Musa acuminata var. zebrina]